MGEFHAAIWVYPWDLLDEGAGPVLDRISDAGLNAVSVAASYHAGKFLRPHGGAARVYFPEDGTVYFRPDLDRYARTPVKPRPSELTREADPLERAAREAAARGMKLVAWTVSLHNNRLGSMHPGLTARNCFGDPYPYSLCPSRPEVREYAKALVSDIASREGVDAVEVETPGFLPFVHGGHHEMYQVELTPAARFLLSLCFCEACLEAARPGVDSDAARRAAAELLERFFAEGPPAGWPSRHDEVLDWLRSKAPEVLDYASARGRTVGEVVTAAADAASAEGAGLFVIPTVAFPASVHAGLEGFDWPSAARADAVEVLGYTSDARALEREVARLRRLVAGSTALHVGLRPAWPDARGPGDVARMVRAAVESGADGLSFYNYGHMRLHCLDWIREALAGAVRQAPH